MKCVVRIRPSGTEFETSDEGMIFDTVINSGINTSYSCTRISCSSCTMGLLQSCRKKVVKRMSDLPKKGVADEYLLAWLTITSHDIAIISLRFFSDNILQDLAGLSLSSIARRQWRNYFNSKLHILDAQLKFGNRKLDNRCLIRDILNEVKLKLHLRIEGMLGSFFTHNTSATFSLVPLAHSAS